MAHEGKLRKINRLITTHNAEGKAIFSDALLEESKMEPLPDNMGFALRYPPCCRTVYATRETIS